jgi:hypothetical protein
MQQVVPEALARVLVALGRVLVAVPAWAEPAATAAGLAQAGRLRLAAPAA